MNHSAFLPALTSPLVWLGVFVLLILVLKSPHVKGQLGEWRVRLLAYLLLDKKIYRRLHNVTLSTPTGTTQIDHVLLSPYGIFVLETKNMKGWIFGEERQPQWTQKLYRRTFRFQNPLHQNYKHLKALQATLGLPEAYLHSVVAFVGNSRFKTPMPDNVTQGGGFIRYIRSIRDEVLSEEQLDTLWQTLQSARHAPTFATHRKHVRQLQRSHDPAAQRLCPRCGNVLLIRTVKSGARAGQQFWGCSAWPDCRMTQPL